MGPSFPKMEYGKTTSLILHKKNVIIISTY